MHCIANRGSQKKQQFVEQDALEGGMERSAPMFPHAAVAVRPCRAQSPVSHTPSTQCVRELGSSSSEWGCSSPDLGLWGQWGLPAGLREMRPCLQEVVAARWSVSPGGGAVGEGQQPAQHQGWCRGHGPLRVFFESMQVQGEPQLPSVPTEGRTLVLVVMGDGDPLTAEAEGLYHQNSYNSPWAADEGLGAVSSRAPETAAPGDVPRDCDRRPPSGGDRGPHLPT